MPRETFEHRIFRCGASDYYGDEILAADRTHTSERLRRISRAGFNGIWLRGVLRDLAPTDLFAKYVSKADERIEALQRLCRRGGRCGLGVWLYFTEPLGLAEGHRFWQDHADLRGHRAQVLDHPPHFCLCSSTDQVRRYLGEGFRQLFRGASLAGAILTTASEHVGHCWTHVALDRRQAEDGTMFCQSKCTCARCLPRGPVEVICEVIETIREGIKRGRPTSQVVAWDWSWSMYLDPPYTKLVKGLGADVVLMGTSSGAGRSSGRVRSEWWTSTA